MQGGLQQGLQRGCRVCCTGQFGGQAPCPGRLQCLHRVPAWSPGTECPECPCTFTHFYKHRGLLSASPCLGVALTIEGTGEKDPCPVLKYCTARLLLLLLRTCHVVASLLTDTHKQNTQARHMSAGIAHAVPHRFTTTPPTTTRGTRATGCACLCCRS